MYWKFGCSVQPSRDLVLVDGCQKPFEVSLRPVGIDERSIIGVERLRAL